MRLNYQLFLALFLLIGFTSCEDDDDVNSPNIDVPATFDFTRGGESTVAFPGQTARLAMGAETASAMKNPALSLEDLNNFFRNPDGVDPFMDPALNSSTKSVRSKIAASRGMFSANTTETASIREDFDGWLAAQVHEVFPRWNELAAVGEAGQIADGSSTRYVNSWGLEYDQAFAKGLVGALAYDQIANHYLDVSVLDEGSNRADNDSGVLDGDNPYTTMEHKWDEGFGYLFGGSATPATPLSDLGVADPFLNKYLGRVEGDPDYAGIAAEIELALRTGRAAVVAGDYELRDEQAEMIKEKLADVVAIRSIYYLMQGKAAIEANMIGSAFHDLSEGYGFIYSLRFIDGSFSVSDGYLETLRNASGNGFWDISPATLEGIAELIAERYDIDLEEAAE